MHNPGLVNVPRTLLLPLHQHFGRMHPASDFIPIDSSSQPQQHQHHQHPPPVFLSHRQPSRYRSHHGNHVQHESTFYNRTERKRESSNADRSNLDNGQPHQVNGHVPQQPQVNGSRLSQPPPSYIVQGSDDKGARKYNPNPWNELSAPYADGIIGLHEEIEAFVQWVAPTAGEHELRLSVINRLRASIKDIYPDAIVQVFGSFRTGLYLPTGDVDLVLVGNWSQIPFEIVRSGIETNSLAKPGSLQLLENATVPIIKMTDRVTEIKVDISFNMTNGLRSVELIKHFKKRFPAMSKLIYVLKQFLLQRDLNEVYTGGLSSYALILMVVSFLQLHPRGEKAGSEKANIGVLLIEFFELYGRHFNYCNTAIRVADEGSYVAKDMLRGVLTMGTGLGSLCIQDPCQPENDVGKSSYGIPVVKTAFEQAYLTLTQLVQQGSGPPKDGESILSQVVKVSDDVIQFREWVKSKSTANPDEPTAQISATNIPSAPTAQTARPCTPTNLNNKDQALSEDPLLPKQIIPTPSRDVLPRELPLKIFGGKQPDVVKNVTNVTSKDTDNMSGVSTATSTGSSVSQTDTDSDVLLVGRAGASSPSGSPSSAMSISPASSEVGGTNSRLQRTSNGPRHTADTAPDIDSKFKQPSPVTGHARGGGRYWNGGHRKSSTTERSDQVLNWRSEGPDKNNDWRNHDSISRPNQERKNSWRDEKNSNNRTSNKAKGTSAESSCGEEKAAPKCNAATPATTPDSSKPPLASCPSKTIEKSDDATPTCQDSSANSVEASRIPVSDLKESNSATDKQLTSCATCETSSSCGSCGSNPFSDQNFVKSKTSNKKRKKQRQNKNKVNNNNNSCNPATAAEPVKSVQVSATVSNSERTFSPQNRFSNKSGRSLPNR